MKKITLEPRLNSAFNPDRAKSQHNWPHTFEIVSLTNDAGYEIGQCISRLETDRLCDDVDWSVNIRSGK